ncbi:MAG: hypothetical protein KKA07_11280 [Bacteroidetes bacterium]|nr:hypothetical protein [Bacteroidota bacterium]MBU1719641.1 hypothetical protein [Bacteroidota bacterium]
MKNLLTSIFVTLCLGMSAQQDYGYLSNQSMCSLFYLSGGYIRNYEMPDNVEVKVFTSRKNGEKHLNSVIKTNQKGKVTEHTMFRKSGKPSKSFMAIYNSEGNRITEIIHNDAKGEQKGRQIFEFGTNNKCSKSVSYKKSNDKEIARQEYKYNNDLLIEQLVFKKGKLSKRMEYRYFDDGSKKETIHYNKKGKIKHSWVYQCKPEGEAVKPHKDTTEICKWSDQTGEGFMKAQRTINEKGKVITYYYYYTMDSVLVSYKCLDSQNRLNYESIMKTKINSFYSFKSYKKGVLLSENRTDYDQDGRMQKSSHTWKGKQSWEESYVYDSDGKVISINHNAAKEKSSYLREFEYISL